jgi:hypothetical protein
MTALYWTNAPEEYDYSYVETVRFLPEGSSWRLIRATDHERFQGFQRPRYGSGLYVSVSVTDTAMLASFQLPELSLNEVLSSMGYTTHDGPHKGQKTVVCADTSFPYFTGRAHEVWDWLRESGAVE